MLAPNFIKVDMANSTQLFVQCLACEVQLFLRLVCEVRCLCLLQSSPQSWLVYQLAAWPCLVLSIMHLIGHWFSNKNGLNCNDPFLLAANFQVHQILLYPFLLSANYPLHQILLDGLLLHEAAPKASCLTDACHTPRGRRHPTCCKDCKTSPVILKRRGKQVKTKRPTNTLPFI
jgi:hypothetical protein